MEIIIEKETKECVTWLVINNTVELLNLKNLYSSLLLDVEKEGQNNSCQILVEEDGNFFVGPPVGEM